jgi:hypothetical protein
MEPYTHIGLSGKVASLFLGYLLMGTSSTKNLKKKKKSNKGKNDKTMNLPIVQVIFKQISSISIFFKNIYIYIYILELYQKLKYNLLT